MARNLFAGSEQYRTKFWTRTSEYEPKVLTSTPWLLMLASPVCIWAMIMNSPFYQKGTKRVPCLRRRFQDLPSL